MDSPVLIIRRVYYSMFNNRHLYTSSCKEGYVFSEMTCISDKETAILDGVE